MASAQESEQQRSPSLGAYAGGIPMQYFSWVSAGFDYDHPIRKSKRLSLSTGVTHSGRWNFRENRLTVTSGLCWSFEARNFVFRPGIQMGYLYIAQGSMEVSGYRLHGLYVKGSTEYMWKIKRCELGVHLNYGIGIGPTRYASGFPPLSLKLGLSGGVGVAFRYKLDHR